MQVTLKESISNGINSNIVILCNSLAELDKYPISLEEKCYIENNLPSEGTKLFQFNHFEYFVFVQYYIASYDENEYRQLLRNEASKLHKILIDNRVEEVLLCQSLSISDSDFLAYFEGLFFSTYKFDKYKTHKYKALQLISLVSETLTQTKVDEIVNLLGFIFDCKDWVNEPVANLNADKFATILREKSLLLGIDVDIFNKERIGELNMGGLLAVNKGSVDEPRFAILEWNPTNAKNLKPIVLVGKGITYDTGGLNIKTGTYMNDMKSDMAGAATVAATLFAVAKNQLPVHLVALIPLTDNRLCGNAYVPGDIITMYDGTTVEVTNTDAEGRIILADAIAFAKNYNPELIIDVATLTGAAQNAIGKWGIVGMHQNAKKDMDVLKEEGECVYERIAEFPFWKEYNKWIESDVADIRNTSTVPNAGMITAGKFLAHFSNNLPFIHLDIAGVAFYEDSESFYGAGATGFGVRLLYQFIKVKTIK
jgi:leucyl aminopeptidase